MKEQQSNAGEPDVSSQQVGLKTQQMARFQVNEKDSFSRQMVEDQTCAKVNRPCAKVSAREALDERPIGEADMYSQLDEEVQGARLACQSRWRGSMASSRRMTKRPAPRRWRGSTCPSSQTASRDRSASEGQAEG